MIERAHLPLSSMKLESEGIVDETNGVITYKQIIHRPTVFLKEEATEKQFQMLEKLAVKAEESCMITRAIKGNVEVSLEANLNIEKNS